MIHSNCKWIWTYSLFFFSCFLQYDEGVYAGSRAGTVSTMLFDNDHNFLLDTLSSTHSDSGEVSVGCG